MFLFVKHNHNHNNSWAYNIVIIIIIMTQEFFLPFFLQLPQIYKDIYIYKMYANTQQVGWKFLFELIPILIADLKFIEIFFLNLI